MAHAVVTGANRGLGLELTRQLLDRGCTVIAGCRHPAAAAALAELAAATGRVTALPLDVADSASIAGFCAEARRIAPELGLLVNNAGILLDQPDLGSVTAEDLARSFAVNAIGPVLMVQGLVSSLAAARGKVLDISSGVASMQNARRLGNGWYGYCASKAALNRLGWCLANELRPSGVGVYSFEPGWVKTDMARGGGDLTPAESISAVLRVLDGLTLEDSGGYFNWRGEPHPW